VTIKATTIYDGDTAPGEGDVGDLTLALDRIDTGIKLNGFPDDKMETRTISGVPVNAGQIGAALKANGMLEASINDADPDDNTQTVPTNVQAQLTIKSKRRR
jgi:hypothetical protein